MFAKLFGNNDDQVLVLKKTDDKNGNPMIEIFFKPEGLDVCSINIEFKDDSDKSFNECDNIFCQIDENTARNALSMAEKIVNKVLEDEECE
jgi:hypothetical protein